MPELRKPQNCKKRKKKHTGWNCSALQLSKVRIAILKGLGHSAKFLFFIFQQHQEAYF